MRCMDLVLLQSFLGYRFLSLLRERLGLSISLASDWKTISLTIMSSWTKLVLKWCRSVVRTMLMDSHSIGVLSMFSSPVVSIDGLLKSLFNYCSCFSRATQRSLGKCEPLFVIYHNRYFNSSSLTPLWRTRYRMEFPSVPLVLLKIHSWTVIASEHAT